MFDWIINFKIGYFRIIQSFYFLFKSLKIVMIIFELWWQVVLENFENVFFLNIGGLESRIFVNRLMSFRIVGVVKINC